MMAKNPRRLLAEPKAPRPFRLVGVSDNQRGKVMKKKIDIAAIPELNTSVGIHGSVKQKEVGGGVCLLCLGVAIVIGL
jgi:hypothetical protein